MALINSSRRNWQNRRNELNWLIKLRKLEIYNKHILWDFPTAPDITVIVYESYYILQNIS